MPESQLKSLSPQGVRQGLEADRGLVFDVGPFRVRAHSRIKAVAEHLVEMYGSFPLADAEFADFHVAIETPRNLRSFWRKQVNFRFDDEFPFKPLPYDQARAFFEWGLNWCIAMTAHQFLIFHAAVVAKGDFCALIPGRPGAGKSTLCAALVASGWRLLSDEMALVDQKSTLVWPVVRPISLKNASIEIIRQRYPSVHLGPLVTDTHKGTIAHLRPFDDCIKQARIPATPAWVIYPGYQAGADLVSTPVSPCNSMIRLADESFNLHMLGAAGFDVLSKMTKQCASHELKYSRLEDAIAWFDELAENGL